MSTTTPQRPNMATQHTQSKTPSRRALGDLTQRAINTPPSHTKGFDPSELTRAQSPLKQVTTYTPSGFVNKENLTTPTAYSASKKRGIDEVEAVETADRLKLLACERDVNRTTQLTTDAVQRHTMNNPMALTDPGSPTERATPSPEPEPLASQRSNQSFSDFLNYDQCASQKSEHAAPLEPAPTSVPALAPAPIIVEETKKRKSRADLLRTRLNFGLYKVKTNQVNKRDSEIISNYEAHLSHATDAYNASRYSAMNNNTSADSLSTPRVPNITVSSPRRDQQGATFVQANLDPFRAIGKLGAAPVLFAPPQENTSVSSHMLHNKYHHLSSSPPEATTLPQSVSPNQLMSPAQTPLNSYAGGRIRMGEHHVGHVESGPVTAHQRFQRLKEQQYRESELSSNAVKGNAAAGLLELMNRER